MLWWLLLSALVVTLGLRRKGGWTHPITLVMAGWVVLLALQLWNPLHLTGPNDTALAAVAAGLAGLTTGALVRARPRVRRPVRLRKPRLTLAALTLGGLCLVGLLAFRANVEAALGGGFGSFTASDVRAATTSGDARGGGLGVLLLALTPILACVGVAGAMIYRSRAWWLAPVLAVAVTLQSPARTTTLTVILTATVFYFYVKGVSPRIRRRRWLNRRRQRLRRKRGTRQVVVVLTVAVASLAYFQSVGDDLGKNRVLRSSVGDTVLPSVLIAPVFQVASGLPGLGEALRLDVDPVSGNHGRSIYALHRAWELVDPGNPAPDTIARFVRMPVPTNVYTAFGDTYFDFGLLGTFLLSALLGVSAAWAHHRALSGRIEWCWVGAVAMSLLALTPVSYRLLALDTLVQLVAGFVVFRWLKRRAPRPQPLVQRILVEASAS